MNPLLPNLFIIGAMKAGTTSLHECLSAHPEIFMTSFKEPQFFAPHRKVNYGVWGQGGNLPEPGVGWYLRLFENVGAVKYAGESSTSYTKAPWVEGCAGRIHAFNPKARLIYLMRDPIERTMSHYWYEVKGYGETRPPVEAVRADERYVAFSDYARQLRPYFDTFGQEAVHVMTLEELVTGPATALDRLFAWLGVEPLGSALSFDSRNVGPSTMRRLRPQFRGLRRMQRHWRWRTLNRRHPALRRLTDRILFQPAARERQLEEAAREYLRPIHREQVKTLSHLLGRDFPEWTTVSGDSSGHWTRTRLASGDARG